MDPQTAAIQKWFGMIKNSLDSILYARQPISESLKQVVRTECAEVLHRVGGNQEYISNTRLHTSTLKRPRYTTNTMSNSSSNTNSELSLTPNQVRNLRKYTSYNDYLEQYNANIRQNKPLALFLSNADIQHVWNPALFTTPLRRPRPYNQRNTRKRK